MGDSARRVVGFLSKSPPNCVSFRTRGMAIPLLGETDIPDHGCEDAPGTSFQPTPWRKRRREELFAIWDASLYIVIRMRHQSPHEIGGESTWSSIGIH